MLRRVHGFTGCKFVLDVAGTDAVGLIPYWQCEVEEDVATGHFKLLASGRLKYAGALLATKTPMVTMQY